MYKKAWCTRKVVVLLIKPIVFLTFLLPFARGGNFRCWPKAETARKKAFRAGHHKDLTEKGKSLVPKIYIPRILREIAEWTVISKAQKNKSSFFQPTRAEAILQKSVKQQKQPTKSTDVLTNAEKWGIQVKPVEQVLKWIEEQTKRQATSRQPSGRVCSLRGAFLKVEDHSR